jgi:hypothetical protein
VSRTVGTQGIAHRHEVGAPENRVTTASNHPGLLPAKFDLPKLQQDTALVMAYSEVLAALDEMRTKVSLPDWPRLQAW